MRMTAQEASKYLGISYQMIRHHLRKAKIKGERVGGIWLVDSKELDKFKAPKKK